MTQQRRVIADKSFILMMALLLDPPPCPCFSRYKRSCTTRALYIKATWIDAKGGAQNRMFTAANVFSILRSLFRLLARRRAKGITRSETTAATVTAAAAVTGGTPEGTAVARAGFNMQAEIAKLAERIVEPVAAKLATQELEYVVERIRSAFEQFAKRCTTADTDFENIAVNILEPVQPRLSEAEFMRIVDRLRGAMVGFCQGDWGQSPAY
jgi:hypothetical protein